MLCRHSSDAITLHVLTEPDRSVPAPFVQHTLELWPGVAGPKKSWWYKLQLFDLARFQQPMIYFDLDIVIVDSVDWIWHTDPDLFWAVKDFWYLWNPGRVRINSSVMRWDPAKFYWIWEDFQKNRNRIIAGYRGDQDYLDAVIPRRHLSFFDTDLVQSWRWQVQDGGWDFQKKRALSPGNTVMPDNANILVFHGTPKPHELWDNSVITQYWK